MNLAPPAGRESFEAVVLPNESLEEVPELFEEVSELFVEVSELFVEVPVVFEEVPMLFVELVELLVRLSRQLVTNNEPPPKPHRQVRDVKEPLVPYCRERVGRSLG